MFRRYLKGDITRIEQKALDQKVQEDSFVQDAKEGMDQISRVNANDSMNNLDARLKARIQKGKSKRGIGWMSIAAGVAIVISAALLILQPSKTNKGVAETSAGKQNANFENSTKQRDINTDDIDFDITVFNQGSVSTDSFTTEELISMIPEDLQNNQDDNSDRRASYNSAQKEPIAAAPPPKSSASETSSYYIDGVKVQGNLIPEREESIAASDIKKTATTEEIISSNGQETEVGMEDFAESANFASEQKSETDDAIVMQSPVNAHVKSESNADLEMASKKVKKRAKEQSTEKNAGVGMILKTVTGIVQDVDGGALIGANVIDTESEIGTLTDFDGSFKFDIPKNVTQLTFDYIGYNSLTIDIPPSNFVTVQMNTEDLALDEVVVTAQSSVKDNASYQAATPIKGNSAFKKYIKENLVYPSQAKSSGIKGKVVLLFNVDNNGTPTDIEVKKSLGFGCDEEAIRLLRDGPKWTQGTLSEKNSISIRFR